MRQPIYSSRSSISPTRLTLADRLADLTAGVFSDQEVETRRQIEEVGSVGKK